MVATVTRGTTRDNLNLETGEMIAAGGLIKTGARGQPLNVCMIIGAHIVLVGTIVGPIARKEWVDREVEVPVNLGIGTTTTTIEHLLPKLRARQRLSLLTKNKSHLGLLFKLYIHELLKFNVIKIFLFCFKQMKYFIMRILTWMI